MSVVTITLEVFDACGIVLGKVMFCPIPVLWPEGADGGITVSGGGILGTTVIAPAEGWPIRPLCPGGALNRGSAVSTVVLADALF